MVRPSQQRGGVTGRDGKVKHSDEEDEEVIPARRYVLPPPLRWGRGSEAASLSPQVLPRKQACLDKFEAICA